MTVAFAPILVFGQTKDIRDYSSFFPVLSHHQALVSQCTTFLVRFFRISPLPHLGVCSQLLRDFEERSAVLVCSSEARASSYRWIWLSMRPRYLWAWGGSCPLLIPVAKSNFTLGMK